MNTGDMGNNPIEVQPGTIIHNNEQIQVNLVIRQQGVNLPRNQVLAPNANFEVQLLQPIHDGQPAAAANVVLTIQRQVMPQ